MNYYPGEGLGIGTAIIGNALGQEYPAGLVFTLCKIFGTLLTGSGTPVGSAGKALVSDVSGLSVVSVWNGVKVTASTQAASAISGHIIAAIRDSVTSNEHGYFELYEIQGLIVDLTCSAFGKPVQVDTTGLTEKDVSLYF